MRYGYSAEQIRAAEAPHLAAGEPLMQLAASALADVITTELDARDASSDRVLLLVGPGNNGGDTLFAGALLAGAGHDVAALAIGSRMHAPGRAAALAAGVRVIEGVPDDELARVAAAEARSAGVIADGILGTGTSARAALREPARGIVAALVPFVTSGADELTAPASAPAAAPGSGAAPAPAPARPLVVAVDIPSGIDPNDGSVPDPTVLPADVTVTFGGYKAGLLRQPAAAFAGEVRLIDIGLGDELAGMTPTVTVPDQPL